MGLFHVAHDGYVWKALFPYRHPEQSRGIFLAYWYSAVCETAEKGYVWKALFLYRHPERSRGIFLAHRYSAVCATAGKGNPSVKGARKNKVQGRFLAALEMTVGGMGLFHVAYNGYVGKTPLPQRHPERSRGIFLAHRYSAVCETAEKGKPSAKESRKSRVQGRFLAALEMTVWGDRKVQET